jgi:hypothetical protein
MVVVTDSVSRQRKRARAIHYAPALLFSAATSGQARSSKKTADAAL